MGNGHLYEMNKPIWQLEDQAWSREVQEALEARFGESWVSRLPLLWDREFDQTAAAEVRLAYMDAATRLAEKNFSEQIGDWCRERGVRYIGHLIEDDNQHTRTGCSLGHYFRGLGGQDMAGIDAISWQVSPGGERENTVRRGRFFHYVLGRLAGSQAVVDPKKHGNAMCEIFGAYGWRSAVPVFQPPDALHEPALHSVPVRGARGGYGGPLRRGERLDGPRHAAGGSGGAPGPGADRL